MKQSSEDINRALFYSLPLLVHVHHASALLYKCLTFNAQTYPGNSLDWSRIIGSGLPFHVRVEEPGLDREMDRLANRNGKRPKVINNLVFMNLCFMNVILETQWEGLLKIKKIELLC